MTVAPVNLVNQYRRMTTNEVAHTAKMVTGAAVSGASATIAYIPQFEAFLRMGASLVAIISGCVVIWFAFSDRRKRKKNKKDHEN